MLKDRDVKGIERQKSASLFKSIHNHLHSISHFTWFWFLQLKERENRVRGGKNEIAAVTISSMIRKCYIKGSLGFYLVYVSILEPLASAGFEKLNSKFSFQVKITTCNWILNLTFSKNSEVSDLKYETRDGKDITLIFLELFFSILVELF